jgi:hypothetical protein
MQQCAADIDVASGAVEQQGDHPVHDDARGRHPHHDGGLHVLGMLQAAECLVKDEERNRDQRDCVDQCGQHSGAMIPISLGRTGRTRLQINRNQRQQQR